MPSLNHLYRTVYQTGAKKYDPDKRQYTIMLAANAPYEGFYDSMEQNLKLRMNDDTISVIPVSEENPNAARLQMREIHDNLHEQYYQPPTNYVFADYIKDGSPEEFMRVTRFREWVEELRPRPADKIFVLYVLRCDKDSEDLAKKIPSAAFEDAHFYWFTLASDATEVRRQALLNSVCGPVILNSFPEEFMRHDQRRNNAALEAENFKKNLNESASTLFSSSERMLWSTLHCRFFDRKMDFLAWYCYHMCDKMKRLDKSIIMEEFRRLYDNSVQESNNRDECKAVLLFAIKMIPTVEPPPNPNRRRRNETNSLKGHFERLYGTGGEKIVDLSLKMTYASLQNEATMPPVQICAQKIYNECKRYYTDDLHSAVQKALEEYIDSELRPELERKENALRAMLSQGDIDEDMLFEHYESKPPVVAEYINKYIEVYEYHNRLDFWVNMSNYLVTAKAELSKLAQESTVVLNEIAAFKQCCKEMMSPIDVPQNVKFEECSIDDILALISGNSSASGHYDIIRRAFGESASAWETMVYNRLDDVMGLQLINNIYKDTEISFEHDTYSIRGYERNGKYLIFGN